MPRRRQQADSGLLEQTIASLVNGVSRQPIHSRRDSQSDEQDNIISDVAAGLVRRPPTEHVDRLTGGGIPLPSPDGAHFSLINRGDGEQFLVVLTEGDVNVYNATTGSQVVVNDNAPGAPGTYGGLDDFSGLNLPASDLFETVTVADYTFIVNKSLVLAQSGGTQNPRTHAHEFLLTTKEGSTNGYTNVVQLHIGTGYWRGATTNVPDSKSSMDSLLSRMLGDVDPVDEQGPITMDTGGGSPDLGLEEFADFRFTRISTNVLYGYQFQNTGTLHRIDAQDWYGDTLHELMATGLDGQDPSVLKFSDLPAEAPTDFVVEVAGDEGNTEDSFFVIYDDERRHVPPRPHLQPAHWSVLLRARPVGQQACR